MYVVFFLLYTGLATGKDGLILTEPLVSLKATAVQFSTVAKVAAIPVC